MSDLVAELEAHLQALGDGLAATINEQLVQLCSDLLPQQLSREGSIKLIKDISSLVPTLPLDPTPLNRLLIALLGRFSFSDILSFSDNIDFVTGLSVNALPYNTLLLSILEKATFHPSDAATVAGRPEIISALITLWLTTPEAGVALRAGQIIHSLLRIDHSAGGSDPASGQGLVWKRIFQDRDVYSLIYSYCASKPKRGSPALNRSQMTLAQSRLLEILPKLCALDWSMLSVSHIRDVEAQYASNPSNGILGFAALDMVNTSDDVLMHKCLIEFYSDLIETVTGNGPETPRDSSLSLDFSMSTDIHKNLLEFYTIPSEERHGVLEVQFLYSSVARYVATYASTYPEHLQGSEDGSKVLTRLHTALDLSPGQWAHQEPPKHDLHVLASLPRKMLLPAMNTRQRIMKDSIIALLPTKHTNADVLNTLASIFRGPTSVESLTFPEESPMMSSIDEKGLAEAQAARALYFLYIAKYNTRMYPDLITIAESVVLTDLATAAINVIASIVNANWAPLPDQPRRGVMAENELIDHLPQPPPATPASGPEAIIAPPSMENTMPWLLKPSRVFVDVGAGRGDSDNMAQRVATAKFEALKSLYHRLKAVVGPDPGTSFESIISTLERTIARGMWDRHGQVGGQIATTEL